MPRFLALSLVSAVLVAGLVFPPLAAYLAVYIVISALFIASIFLVTRHWELLGANPFRLVWFAVLILLATLPFVYKGIEDLFVFAALLPVFLAPAVVMLMREEPRFASPMVIGSYCLAGAIGAVAVALNDVFVLHIERASGGNNSIHFGGLSLVIGFMALLGLFGSRSSWRFIFLSGPILGMVAALLSGSRGPALAAIALVLATAPLLVRWFWRERAFKIILVVGAMGIAIGVTQIDMIHFSRAANVLGDLAALFDNGVAIDHASKERLVFYQAALEAFREAPIFGHGSGHIGSSTTPYIPETFSHMYQPAHLHNDIADFAVLGGVFGILAYLCLVASPLIVFRSLQDRETRRATTIGGIVLFVGYFTLGLTNAMFGILPQTVLFGLLLGVLTSVAYVSQHPE